MERVDVIFNLGVGISVSLAREVNEYAGPNSILYTQEQAIDLLRRLRSNERLFSREIEGIKSKFGLDGEV